MKKLIISLFVGAMCLSSCNTDKQGESGAAVDAEVNIVDANTVEGWVRTAPEYCKKYQKGATITMY